MIMAYQAVMEGEGLRKGSWLEDEDERLTTFVTLMGERRWDSIARASGLKRSGKSCRLRWLNYLRPNLKHGDISMEEERIILQLHELWGNKWSRIARSLPGRTDNEIKNYWRTHLRKKVEAQEEGNFVCKLSNAEQDMYDYENHGGSVGDLLGTTDNSSDDLAGLSNFELTSSPYETRLLDWISELSNDQSEIKHHEDYCINSLESCFCYPAWIPDDHSSDTWNCSAGSLWAMD